MRLSQAQFERQHIEPMPAAVARLLREGHAARIGEPSAFSTSPLYVANQWLARESSDLKAANVARAFDEQAIRDHAENYARIAARMPSLDRREAFAASTGIVLGDVFKKAHLREGRLQRLENPQWWRRQLRKVWTRNAEDSMRALGVVRIGRSPYASREAIRHRAGQKRRAKSFLEASVAVNEAGEQLELLKVAEKSLANPALRRGEFMTRVRGFEEIARDLGHVGEFVTLTTPSFFHAQLSSGGRNPAWGVERSARVLHRRTHARPRRRCRNRILHPEEGGPCFEGESYRGNRRGPACRPRLLICARLYRTQYGERPRVRAAQQWLCKMWARARAKLQRLSVTFYGFRIAEPHHDATPHWHMLCFLPARHVDTLRSVLRGMWLGEFGHERGAREHRTKFESIDPDKGSAASYVAKYVSKNIDGEGDIGGSEDYETDGKIKDGLRGVDAWASIHGIRQFQQLGGVPVGLWREARRLRSAVDDADLERARAAADGGCWREFSYAACPEPVPCRKTALKLYKEPARTKNRYGEDRPDQVIGLRYASAIAVTRMHVWRIERKGQGCAATPPAACTFRRATGQGSASSSPSSSSLGPVAITVRNRQAAARMRVRRGRESRYAYVATVPYRAQEGPI